MVNKPPASEEPRVEGAGALADGGAHSEQMEPETFCLASSARTGSILQAVGVPLSVVRLGLGMRILSGLIVVGFLVHLTLTEASFGLLTCTDIEPDLDLAAEDQLDTDEDGSGRQLSPSGPDECPAGTEGRRLMLDMDVCCYNPAAMRLMFGVGIPAILLLAVGIPLAAAVRLWQVREQLTTPGVLATLGFLMAGFRRDAYYWEVVIMLRKLAVVAITVLAEPWGVRVQTYSALGVIFAASVVHSLSRPYVAPELNTLELVALVGAFLTFEAGLFLLDPNSGAATITVATAVVFVANLAVMMWGIYVIRSNLLRRV